MQKVIPKKVKSGKYSSAGAALLRHAVLAAVCCVGLLIALLAGTAQLACQLELPLHTLLPLSTAVCCLAVLPSSLLLAWLEGKRGLLCGALFGLGMFALLWIGALAMGQGQPTGLAILKGVAMTASGALGGYLGILLRSEQKRLR